MAANNLSYRAAVRRAKSRGYYFADSTDYVNRKWPEKKNYYLTGLHNGKPGKFFYSIREAMDYLEQIAPLQSSQDRIKQPDLDHSTSILSPFHL
jgi:hypothetical protein